MCGTALGKSNAEANVSTKPKTASEEARFSRQNENGCRSKDLIESTGKGPACAHRQLRVSVLNPEFLFLNASRNPDASGREPSFKESMSWVDVSDARSLRLIFETPRLRNRGVWG